MAAIYKALISSSLERVTQRVHMGLANVQGPTAIAENDVKEVKWLIRELKSDKELLLETSREIIRNF